MQRHGLGYTYLNQTYIIMLMLLSFRDKADKVEYIVPRLYKHPHNIHYDADIASKCGKRIVLVKLDITIIT
jgi:hypothetical protein